MSKIPAINEIDANSPSQESTEVVVKATTVTPDINEIQETISGAATIQEIDGTRKPTISEIYKIVNDGLFESTTNWWDYAYKLSQAQINQDIISRLDNGVIGGGYSKGVDIITTTSNKVPSNTNVYSALKSDSLYPKKLNDEVINGIYDFLNGITIGKSTAYTGGTWSIDKVGKTHLTTDYLYVRLKAIFETLQILNVDTIGGKLVISPAGSIRVAYVDRIKIDAPVFKHDEKTDIWSISQVEDAEGNLVNETLNQEVYRCYFLGEQDGEEIENKWKIGDQAQAKTFNVKKGTYHKVENSYLWRLVVNVSTDTVDIDGKKYHYVDLSQIDFDSGSDAPAPGDVLNQLGHRLNDTQRQTALVLNAVDNYAPSITLYAGINYYTYLNKEYVEFGVYNGKAFFNVYGDMYIGDKGINPISYIKYKNGKINIKANLEIGSSIGDTDLDKYIKENGGVDEETVKKLINNSQVIKDLQKQTDGAIETWFYEGVPTPNNYPSTDKENKGDVLTYNIPGIDWYNEDINNYNAIKDSDKYTEAEKAAIKIKVRERHIGDLYYDQKTGYAYRFTRYDDNIKPYRWNVISDSELTKILEAANKAQATADGKMKVFYGETKPTNYQAGDIWVNAILAGKFNNDIARAVAENKTSFNADDWVLASRYSEAIATIQKWTNEYETKFSNLAEEVKQQKDQSIVVWYYDYEPTVDNIPANTWNTNDLRSEHIGDIFYDIKNNHSYRWTGSAWSMIKDADFDEAMKKAKDAEDLADKKRQIFYSDTTPTGGDRGDLWMKQVGNKTEVWVFDGTNWVKSNDKALADYSEAINRELEGIKGQLDGKAETWYQSTDPSNNWTNKTSHKGDIWYNTTDGTTQYWNGTAWEKMDIPKDVFDTIDGKSSIFVDSYDDAKAGKGVISNGYNERDIWILPADAIINGVQYYKGDILTATADGTVFNEKHWTKKVRYVGDKELTAAIETVNKKIGDISATTLPGLNDKFNEFAKDGILDSSEKARLTDLLNQANNEVLAVNDQITSIIKSDYLAKDNANKGKLIEAQKSLSTAWTEYKTLIDTLIASTSPITKNNIAEASTKYTNLQNYIKAVKQYLAACQADVLSNIGIDINSYKYLKEAFKGKTEINGGLVVTNVLQLRQTSDVNSPITAGISGLQGKANANGVVDKDTYDITSIAAWFGGPMVDKDIFTAEQLNNKVAGTDYARSLFRHDGSGYLASGAIYWGTNGILHGDPNSFILQGTSFATIFHYTRLFYLHYATQNTTDFNDIDYITPKKTFSRLNILPLGGIETSDKLPTGLFIGDSKTGGSFQVGNVIIRTKKENPNILEIVSADSNKTAHLGVQGGVSAYGTYTHSTGGGGGLSGTIVPYATAIASDPQNEGTKIASASSIYKLHSRISNIENDGATSITVTGTGNAITSVSKDGTRITFTKGSTFLTSHQSLAAYLTKSEASSTYQPKGNYLTSHQSLSNYYTKSQVDSIASGKSSTSHTHKVKINGDIKTITSDEDSIVNLGNYLTSHQSLAAYATQNWVKNEATAHNADMIDNYHASGLLTAISNVDKGISITVGGTTKSVSNINVNYASSAGNADTVDSYHASHLLVKRGRLGAYNIDKETTFGTRDIQPDIEVAISGKKPFNGWGTLLVIGSIDGASNNQLAFTGDNRMFIRCAYGTSNNYNTKDWATVALTSDNVASSTKLQTARKIWGQSFDGTGDITGVMTINPSTISVGTDNTFMFKAYTSTGYKNGLAISSIDNITRLYAKPFGTGTINSLEIHTYNNNADVNAVTISASGNVGIGNTPGYKLDVEGDVYSSKYIRAYNGFVKINSSDKYVLLGGGGHKLESSLKVNNADTVDNYHATDGRTFNGNINWSSNWNDVWSDGTNTHPWYGFDNRHPNTGPYSTTISDYFGMTIRTANILKLDFRTLHLNDVFSNFNFLNLTSETGLNINIDTKITRDLSVNGLIVNKGILPSNYEFNNKGTNCYVSADALCSGITAITDSIPVANLDVNYSNDNGTNWTRINLSNDDKFKTYANTPGYTTLTLGNNLIPPDIDPNVLAQIKDEAEKLAQIKKNQLMYTFDIPSECYSQVYFASIDITNGVSVICTVEFISKKGDIVNTFTKNITGWSQVNYINLSDGNIGFPVGNDNRRYIRFKFKHDQNTTQLRNAIINRIRIFSFTKYSYPTDRFMGHTGHIYNFDYNMNTYFPNSILAEGGVTAYQSSDVRLKTNITKLNCLKVIKSIGGTYEFDYIRDHKHSIGFIAQHVNNPLLKDIIAKDKDGYLKINYWSPKLISLAFGALTEIDNEVDKLKARVRELETEVEYLKNKDYALQ